MSAARSTTTPDPPSAVTLERAAGAALEATGGGAALAIVTRVATVPARLLAWEDGRREGTLGSAALDAAALALAHRVLADGGVAITELRTDAPASGESGAESGDQITLYAEAHRAPQRLVIVGAGHIAVPLAALGIQLGFTTVVLDDRDEFTTDERFAPGVRVDRVDFDADPFAAVDIDAHTYLALVTRGHRWDFDCLRRLLQATEAPAYIGMIGSRRRVRAAFHALLTAGFTRAQIARVHAPIGIEIGAETPAEIAVSIAAELIAVRRGVPLDTLSARERVADRFFPDPSTT